MRFVEVGDVADVNPTVPKSLRGRPGLAVSFLPMASVSEDGLITSADERPLGEVLKGYRYFEQNDVLVAKITPCMENGKAAIAANLPHDVGFGSTEFHVLRPTPELDARYLFYMVWNARFRSIAGRNMTGTAGQKRVPTDFMRRWKIPLPPVPEQRRIANILDKADAIRRKRQEAVKLADEFLRSAFLEMFGDPVTNPKGWPVVEIGEVTESKLGKMLSKASLLGVNPVPYMGNSHVRWRSFDLSDLPEMDFTAQELTKLDLRNGDLLVCEGGEVGRCAIWREQMTNVSFQKALHRVRCDASKLLPEYLQEYFARMAHRGGLARSTSTATIAHLTGVRLRKLPLPLPPLGLQLAFQSVYLKHATSLGRYGSPLADHLFDSLVQRAFRGEL